jgi:hypothetical protein
VDRPRPTAPWPQPPRPLRGDGGPRRVGVEIEFAGLTVPAAAAAVAAATGGAARVDGAHRCAVEGAPWGPFRVELDMAIAHRRPDGAAGRALRELVLDVAGRVAPVEVVCPPIPVAEARVVDDIAAALTGMGAEGTRDGLLYAFGLQLNVEPASLDPAALLADLRAFLLLRDWLRADIAVDPVRDLWRFADPFEDAYCAAVLDPGYAPDLGGLIDDYLADNPTRDRELDALPLFCWLDPGRVRAAAPREKINARPAWHYRLPNSEIGAPGWRPGAEWARWLRVERLAADASLLASASAEWLANHDSLAPQDWTPRSAALAAALADDDPRRDGRPCVDR